MNRSVSSRFLPLLISVLLGALALPGAAFADDPVAIQGSGASFEKLANGNTLVRFNVRVQIFVTPLVFNYYWERSDGAKSQMQVQRVQPGTTSVPVMTTWELGPNVAHGEVWEKLLVNTGNTHLESEPVRITLSARPPNPIAIQAAVSAAVALREPVVNSGDQQGFAVALSADGTLALVGAPGATVNGQALAGKAYLYMLSQHVWKRTHEFDDPAGAGGDQFGSAVALSGDGSIAVIGAPATAANNGNGAAGQVYVFTAGGGSWATYPLPEPGASAIDAYGSAVAISADGGLAVVGAPAFSNNLGKAYVFQLSSGMPTGGGMELDDPTAEAGNEHFGAAAAFAALGNAILIGAPVGGNGEPSGKAYLFTGQGLSWNASHEFDNPAADLPGNFGASVALSQDASVALIGTPGAYADPDNNGQGDGVGAAYVFVQSGGTWAAPVRLSDAVAVRLESFGAGVALSGNAGMALVGAVNAPDSGAVFLFKQADDNWTQVRRIADPGHADAAAFGNAVALSADGATILAGAANTGVAGRGGAGTAYVFSPVIVLAVNIKSDPPAAAGRSFRYYVSVTNTDASVTATHVVMRDSLQSGVAYDFPSDPACTHTGAEIRCNWPALAPGDTRQIVVGVTLNTQVKSFTTKAVAAADQTEPDDPHDQASLTMTVSVVK